jgi:hypothetical protein
MILQQRWDALPPAVRATLLLVILALVLGGTAPYFEGLLDANERPRLLAGIALVEQGSVRVDGPWAAGIPVGPDVALADDGSLVPNKPPGATLVAALAWLLLRASTSVLAIEPTLRAYTILARVLGGLIPTLLLVALIWRHERAWARASDPGAGGAGARWADFAVLAWLLATPAWANAKLLFGHSLAACLLGAAVISLVGLPSEPGQPERRLSPAMAFTAGLLAGAAVLVEYSAVFAGPAIAIWLPWRARGRWPVIAAALVGALIPIAALAGYHDAVFGSPWATGYHRVVRDEFAAIHGRGLLGLQLPSANSLYEHLVSPWGGLLVWAPLCVLGILGGLHAARVAHAAADRAQLARQVLYTAVAASLVLVLIGLEQGGGWRVGPRYYVLAMPLTIPGLAMVGRALARPGRGPGLALALVVGLTLAATVSNFLAANWFPHLIPHGNPLGDLLGPLVRSGRVAHGISPWIVATLAAGLWTIVAWRLRASLGGRAWPLLLGVGIGGVLLVSQFTGPASDPLAELELEIIERLWEPDSTGGAPGSRILEID